MVIHAGLRRDDLEADHFAGHLPVDGRLTDALSVHRPAVPVVINGRPAVSSCFITNA
jgi:hypothetical protein